MSNILSCLSLCTFPLCKAKIKLYSFWLELTWSEPRPRNTQPSTLIKACSPDQAALSAWISGVAPGSMPGGSMLPPGPVSNKQSPLWFCCSVTAHYQTPWGSTNVILTFSQQKYMFIEYCTVDSQIKAMI